jgi:hypothetical protein
MAKNCDPEEMRARARLFWDRPGTNERFRQQKAVYWSNAANREKASREIKQRFADNPAYAKNVSEGKKRQYRDNPELARRHGERMKKRFAQNSEQLSKELSEQAHRMYREDPTLIKRMAEGRKRFYQDNPDARARAGVIARDRADRRRTLRGEVELLAEAYRARTGKSFPIPSRSEGGWQEAVMLELIDRLKTL